MQTTNSISVRWIPKASLFPWLAGFALTALLWLLLLREQFHLLAAVIVGGTLLLVALCDRNTASLLTIGYLLVMGDLRRLLGYLGPQPTFDPLLLVGPAMAVFLAAPVLLKIKLRDPLSKLMLAILALMVLEIFNPRQGSLSVGVSGGFFYIVPMLWFWAGRSVQAELTIERLLYRVILPLGVLASIVGLCQTYIGVLPYQRAWVESVTRVYGSLYVGGSIRPFGFSISAAEYSGLLMLAVLTSISALFTNRRAWFLMLPLLGTALVLASGRGVIVRTLFALTALMVVRRRKKIKLVNALAMCVFAALLMFGVSRLAGHFLPAEEKPLTQKNTAAQDFLFHQFGGLAHPFDQRYSTASVHANMVVTGLLRGLRSPVGSGLGYSTFAAQKLHGGPYDNAGQGSSEVDLVDMFIDLGFIGGLFYISAVGLILYRSLDYVQIAPLHISLPLFAILLATTGGWLTVGQYSTSSLSFFLIGAFTQTLA